MWRTHLSVHATGATDVTFSQLNEALLRSQQRPQLVSRPCNNLVYTASSHRLQVTPPQSPGRPVRRQDEDDEQPLMMSPRKRKVSGVP